MINLQAIKAAALEYQHGDRDDEEWPVVQSNFHCVAAEPARILEMATELEQWRAGPSQEETAALLQLVRDLTGYIRMTAGDKADPVRDDLLSQARMLLGVIEG